LQRPGAGVCFSIPFHACMQAGRGPTRTLAARRKVLRCRHTAQRGGTWARSCRFLRRHPLSPGRALRDPERCTHSRDAAQPSEGPHSNKSMYIILRPFFGPPSFPPPLYIHPKLLSWGETPTPRRPSRRRTVRRHLRDGETTARHYSEYNKVLPGRLSSASTRAKRRELTRKKASIALPIPGCGQPRSSHGKLSASTSRHKILQPSPSQLHRDSPSLPPPPLPRPPPPSGPTPSASPSLPPAVSPYLFSLFSSQTWGEEEAR